MVRWTTGVRRGLPPVEQHGEFASFLAHAFDLVVQVADLPFDRVLVGHHHADVFLGYAFGHVLAVFGNDALVVSDGHAHVLVAEFVHGFPDGSAFDHEHGRVGRPERMEGHVLARDVPFGDLELLLQGRWRQYRVDVVARVEQHRVGGPCPGNAF